MSGLESVATRMPVRAPETLLTLRGLTVQLGDRALVDGIDLAVARGGATGLVGESGSGKSLTLRSLLALTPSSDCAAPRSA